MIKLAESKKINEEGTQVGGVLSNPVDNNIMIDDEDNKKKKRKMVNEYADMTNVESGLAIAKSSVECDDIANDANDFSKVLCDDSKTSTEFTKRDNSFEYDDPRYYDIIDKLAEAGYSAKFFGSEGYLISNNSDSNVRIICRTISEGFKVNVVGGLISGEEGLAIAKSINKASKLINELNAILTSVNDIDESISVDLLGLGELND